MGFPLQSGQLLSRSRQFQASSCLVCDSAQDGAPGVLAMVNEAMAYARMGENQKANDALQQALKVAPENAAANFNMGLLKAEENDLVAAEKHLRAAFKSDPQMAQAAYNLDVILSKDRLDEAVDFCRKAAELRPDQPKYAYTLAFYQREKGDLSLAANALEELIVRHHGYTNAYFYLGDIYEQQDKNKRAEHVYRKVLADQALSDQERHSVEARLKKLETQ